MTKTIILVGINENEIKKYFGEKITDDVGKSIIRLYDPSGHLIEVGETVDYKEVEQ